MREIKFRQALFEFDKFIGWHYWGFTEVGKFEGPATNTSHGMKSAQERSYQYTGLHDKNGKEIYEGDVIQYRESTFEDWNKGEIVYMAEHDYPAFDVEPTIDCDANGLSYIKACCDVEVIGNIYENPELTGG